MMAHCIFGGSKVQMQINVVFLFLKIHFVVENSADPGEMPQTAAFHLGLHCKSTGLQICSLQRI